MGNTRLLFLCVFVLSSILSHHTRAESGWFFHAPFKREPTTTPPSTSFDALRDVTFFVYNSLTPAELPHLVARDNHTELAASAFNASLETRILIHGWYDDVRSKLSADLRAAYAKRGRPLNIIVVDWGRGARTANYFLAKKRVHPVGVSVAAFIDFLCADGHRTESVGLVGHSLGAHVAGIAGKHVHSGQVASIVGLDAALPLFWHDQPAGRLHIGDAAYVEGIHTNIGFKGVRRPFGHADFYPNWGKRQPGCGWDVGRPCSHKRAIGLFAETIVAAAGDGGLRALVGKKCAGGWLEIMAMECVTNGTAPMGGEPLNGGGSGAVPKSGAFYVPTNGASPFAVA